MRLRYLPIAMLFLSANGLVAQDLSFADSTAILEAMERWEEGWRIKDPGLATQDYSADADWTNAFGTRRLGRMAIHELLVEVFDLPFVMAGDTDYEYHDLTSMGPTVALLRSRSIRVGQQLPDGTVQEPRRINHLRVFQKQGEEWLIVSHLIGDERTPGQPR